jgi:hypothetical protein
MINLSSMNMHEKFEILPTIPRRTGRQINRAGHPADNPSQFWQRSMYYPFMDYYITELTARLLENGSRYQAQYLRRTEYDLPVVAVLAGMV